MGNYVGKTEIRKMLAVSLSFLCFACGKKESSTSSTAPESATDALNLVVAALDSTGAGFEGAASALRARLGLLEADSEDVDHPGCTTHSEPFSGGSRQALDENGAALQLFSCKYTMTDGDSLKGSLTIVRALICIGDKNKIPATESATAEALTVKKDDSCFKDMDLADMPDTFGVTFLHRLNTSGDWAKTIEVKVDDDETTMLFDYNLSANGVSARIYEKDSDRFVPALVSLNQNGLSYESLYAAARSSNLSAATYMDTRHVRAFVEGTVDFKTGKFSKITRAQGYYAQTGYGVAILDGVADSTGFKTHGSSLNGSDGVYAVGTPTTSCEGGDSTCSTATLEPFTTADSDFWKNELTDSEEYNTWATSSAALEFKGDLPRTWLVE